MQFCTELFCVDPWGSAEKECRLVYFLCWDLLYNVTKGHMTSAQNMPLAWRVPQAVKMFPRFGQVWPFDILFRRVRLQSRNSSWSLNGARSGYVNGMGWLQWSDGAYRCQSTSHTSLRLQCTRTSLLSEHIHHWNSNRWQRYKSCAKAEAENHTGKSKPHVHI